MHFVCFIIKVACDVSIAGFFRETKVANLSRIWWRNYFNDWFQFFILVLALAVFLSDLSNVSLSSVCYIRLGGVSRWAAGTELQLWVHAVLHNIWAGQRTGLQPGRASREQIVALSTWGAGKLPSSTSAWNHAKSTLLRCHPSHIFPVGVHKKTRVRLAALLSQDHLF